jgi:hypothetical protein
VACPYPKIVAKKIKNCQLPTYFVVKKMGIVGPSQRDLFDGCYMDLRELKALELDARSKIAFHLGAWLVPSQTTSTVYRVTLNPPARRCEDFALNDGPRAVPRPVLFFTARRPVRQAAQGMHPLRSGANVGSCRHLV